MTFMNTEPTMLTKGLPNAGMLKLSAELIWQRRLRSNLDRLLWRMCVNIPPACWRMTEFSIALLLSLVLLPVLIGLYALAKCMGGGVKRTVRMGENAKEFEELSFCFNGGFGRTPGAAQKKGKVFGAFVRLARRLPALANVVKANMSLVGPRTLSRNEISFGDRAVWKRFGMRPGLIGLWWVRQRANIAYDRESLVDAEYADSKGMRTDLGILLRSVPAAFYGSAALRAPRRIRILGVPIDNITMAEAIGEIESRMSGAVSTQVCFVNADCVNIAHRDAAYASILNQSDLVLADGIGVKLAGNLLNTPICQNVNGTDLLPRLCARLAELESSSVYLLGGLPGVAAEVKAWMEKTYPGLNVSGTHHGYFPETEVSQVVQNIRLSGAKVLLVAMGAPKQEKWIREHAAASGVPVSIGVGGLFDFYAGRVQRAPQWVREIGMEWFYRFYQEPGRMWKRYLLGNLVFAMRTLLARAKNILGGKSLSQ